MFKNPFLKYTETIFTSTKGLVNPKVCGMFSSDIFYNLRFVLSGFPQHNAAHTNFSEAKPDE